MGFAAEDKSGFSLIQLMIVVSTLGVILSVAIPNFRGLQREGAMEKAEDDLAILKTALLTYWKNNHQNYPPNIHSGLTLASPVVITEPLNDPWRTDQTNLTYGYLAKSDPTFGNYFILYTRGPKGDTSPVFNAAKQRVEYSGSGTVVSNVPMVKN